MKQKLAYTAMQMAAVKGYNPYDSAVVQGSAYDMLARMGSRYHLSFWAHLLRR
jgi:hypothetical protein